MKKSLLLAAAALAVGALSSLAKPSNLESQNIVGYVTQTLPGSNNTYAQINVPLWAGTNTVEGLMPAIKKGDKISLWTGDRFIFFTYAGANFDGQDHAWMDSQGRGQNSPVIHPGRAFLYQNNGHAFTKTFIGTVPLGGSTTIPGGHAYTLLASALPIAGPVDTAFSLPLQAGDKIFIMAGESYQAFTYRGANFDGQGHAFVDGLGEARTSPVIQVGQSFFYQNNQDSPEIWNQKLKI